LKAGTPSRALPEGRGIRIAIVASRFHEAIVERLLDGAAQLLRHSGVAEGDLAVERVPGAWEIPPALELMARRGKWDAMLALGALVRGETLHFQLIAEECARGIAAASRRHGVPIAFGVLTCETMEQAWARAGGAAGHQGEEAAAAALEMAVLRRKLES
jgi:6,7-dimethyl-8-ribityllumazine synthase